MYKTFRATGICRSILKIVSWWTRKTLIDGKPKIWFIYNPFKRQIQSLIPTEISMRGKIYKHEIDGHEAQLDRSGLGRFCAGTTANVAIFGYTNSPMEREARSHELV